MNTTDGTDPRGNNLYRWFAHPLTTLIVLLISTMVSAVVMGPGFALTVFAGAISFATACAAAYKAT